MGEKEERTGNVVAAPAIVGEPWWLISRADGTGLCCHKAASWFEARDIGRKLTEHENVSAVQIERKKMK
jgi:hypothetical protein